MKYTVGQQLLGGFFTVVSVDTTTGNALVTVSSQALGDASGPFIFTITPSTTLAALDNLATALMGLSS